MSTFQCLNSARPARASLTRPTHRSNASSHRRSMSLGSLVAAIRGRYSLRRPPALLLSATDAAPCAARRTLARTVATLSKDQAGPNEGMTGVQREALELARQTLQRELQVAAIKTPAAGTGRVMGFLKDHVLKMPRVHTVVKPDSEPLLQPGAWGGSPPALCPAERLVLLSTEYAALPPSQLPSEVRALLVGPEGEGAGNGASTEATGMELVQHTLRLPYTHLQADEVLAHLLPKGVTVPSGHEEVGHILHLNLRDEHWPHRHLIGQVLLEKNHPRIRTVVNKVNPTGGAYRVFEMEVLAGESDLETTLVENGVMFALDFGRMYWNSRLSGERERLLALMGEGDVLCDACCGVGPIAVAAAKIVRCVYANDLNPAAVDYLRQNAVANGVVDRVQAFNMDGGEFLREQVTAAPGRALPTHIVMNLPSHAVELLLPSLRGAFARADWAADALPTLHVYTFSREEDGYETDVQARICNALDVPESDRGAIAFELRRVRNVAPGKYMFRATFRMPAVSAFAD